jgi:hypothetical protein
MDALLLSFEVSCMWIEDLSRSYNQARLAKERSMYEAAWQYKDSEV